MSRPLLQLLSSNFTQTLSKSCRLTAESPNQLSSGTQNKKKFSPSTAFLVNSTKLTAKGAAQFNSLLVIFKLIWQQLTKLMRRCMARSGFQTHSHGSKSDILFPAQHSQNTRAAVVNRFTSYNRFPFEPVHRTGSSCREPVFWS